MTQAALDHRLTTYLRSGNLVAWRLPTALPEQQLPAGSIAITDHDQPWQPGRRAVVIASYDRDGAAIHQIGTMRRAGDAWAVTLASGMVLPLGDEAPARAHIEGMIICWSLPEPLVTGADWHASDLAAG